MSLRYIIGVLVVGIAALLLAASPVDAAKGKCKRGKTGQVAGSIAGGLLGGLFGNRLVGGSVRGVGTAIGAVGGSLVGSAIGRKLDKCEQEKYAAATVAAVQDNERGAGTPQAWQSDTRKDVHGTAVASAPVALEDGRECRSVARISYIAGEEVRDEPRMCRKPPQTGWSVA